jgi:hypothetical protein
MLLYPLRNYWFSRIVTLYLVWQNLEYHLTLLTQIWQVKVTLLTPDDPPGNRPAPNSTEVKTVSPAALSSFGRTSFCELREALAAAWLTWFMLRRVETGLVKNKTSSRGVPSLRPL